eukprot:GEMP01094488.1.p2 GENE.GEMP01094488.1~~GEMP01094488.1.p2  ORF type:complete len:100 (+),score=19.33 GEMP01094488.1:466-765(+)
MGSVLVFNTKGCHGENEARVGAGENILTAQWDTKYCGHLRNHWRDMICGNLPTQFSGCTDAGCICFAPAIAVIDPQYDDVAPDWAEKLRTLNPSMRLRR